MRRRKLGAVVAAGQVALLGTAGCGISLKQGGGNSGGSSAGGSADAPRIDVDAARAAVQAGTAVLVDVRGAESYRQRRAAGAVLLTLDDIEKDPTAAAGKLPAGKQPILYCT